MIDRKTALLCAVMIAPMFVAGVILVWDGRTIRAVHGGAPLPVLLPFFLPACGALVTASLYWTGRSAVADDAKKAPCYRWGRLVSISYCAGLLLLQAVVIAAAFDLHVPPPIARTLSVVMAMMSLLAINQMPKLPWFERRWRPGGQLGPVYGPKYIRIASRMTVAFMIAVFAYVFVVAPGTGFRAVPYILVGAALLVVWSVAWRRHLGRKWSLERGGVRL